MKKAGISLLLLTLATLTYSQQAEVIAGFFRIGYTHSAGTGKIMNAIAGNGITGFSDNFLLVGAEINYRYHRHVIIVEGYIGAQGDCSVENQYAEPFTGAAHLKYGRVIAYASNYWIYPAIGTGASMTALGRYQKVNGEFTVNENASLVSPSFDLSLNGNVLLTKPEYSRKRYGGFIIGCRIGYRTSPKNDHWYNDSGTRIQNMPSYSNRGFYLTLAVGAGGFRKL